MSDPAVLGYPYLIGDVVMAALRTDPALAGAVLRDNPSAAADISEGERLLIYKDQADSLREQSGNAAERTFTFQIGALSRARNARTQAHTDYRAARRAVRACIADLYRGSVKVQAIPRETNVSYQLEHIDVGGALVLGTFTVDYRDPSAP